MREINIFPSLKKTIFLILGLILFIWLLDKIIIAILIFWGAFTVSIVLNPAVSWFQRKKVPRAAGTAIIIIGGLIILFLIGYFLFPPLISSFLILADNIPQYLAEIGNTTASVFHINAKFAPSTLVEGYFDSVKNALYQIGRFSLKFLEVLTLVVIFISAVIYALNNPKPLIKGYLALFPENLKEDASEALAKSFKLLNGWLWANLIIGAAKGFFAAIFLYFFGIPGAIIWGVFAIIAELIPKLGPYIMAIPPILIALAISPMKALWVFIFYLIMEEVVDDIFTPLIRAKTMIIHPVFALFAVVALAYAFGFWGAFLAMPIAGFSKAFYDVFWLKKQKRAEANNHHAENIIHNPAKKSGD